MAIIKILLKFANPFWRHGRVARQGSAKARTAVRICLTPPE